MKWKIMPEPQAGDIRHRQRFAWLPVYLKFEDVWYKVWLETYGVTELYVKSSSVKELQVYGKEYWMEIDRRPLFGEYESV